MKTYSAIKAEIARLERQAEAVRKAEVSGVVDRIKDAIAAYGLTAADLFGRASSATRTAVKRAAKRVGRRSSRTVGVAKYRDPATGKTWTGQGRPPEWIASAKDRDSFLIAGSSAGANGKARKAAKKAARPGKRGRTAGKRSVAGKAAVPPAAQIESGPSE